jgi:hypothetical protein
METPDPRKHKGLGIASFVITVVSFVLVLLAVVIAGVVTMAHKATPEINTIIGLFLFIVWLLDLIGIGLGIAGALDRTSKKVFPILGIVIGAAVLLGSAAIVAIGFAVRA